MSDPVAEDMETYWRNRATTAEEKVKEWSVRACEAEERISKAKAILDDMRRDYMGSHWYVDGITRALEALEGK